PALDYLIGKLRSFGARIEELSPDRVIAVFGFEPVEDAPRRAAHAALAMLKAFERREASPPQQLTARIAIHVSRCLIAESGGVAGAWMPRIAARPGALSMHCSRPPSPAPSWSTRAAPGSWHGASSCNLRQRWPAEPRRSIA